MVSFKNAATAVGVAAAPLLLQGCGSDECKDFDTWAKAWADEDCLKCVNDKLKDCAGDSDCTTQKAAEDCGFEGEVVADIVTTITTLETSAKIMTHSTEPACHDCVSTVGLCAAEANTIWENNKCRCKCDHNQKDPRHCRSCEELACCDDPNATWHSFTSTCYCTWDTGFQLNWQEDTNTYDSRCPDGGEICSRDKNATWNPLTKTCTCTYDPRGKVGDCKSAEEWQCSQDVNAVWDKVAKTCQCKYDDECDTIGSCPTEAESKCDKDANATWNPITHVCSCIYDAANEFGLKTATSMCPSADRIKCAKDPNAKWNVPGTPGFDANCSNKNACVCEYDPKNGTIGQCPSVEKACLVNHGTWVGGANPDEQCKCSYKPTEFFTATQSCPSPPQVLCDADINATWNEIDETCKCTHGIGKLGFCPSKEEIACNHDQFAQWNAVTCKCSCLWDENADPNLGPCPSPELKKCMDDKNATWDGIEGLCKCTYDPTCGDIGNCPTCDMVECSKNPLAFWDMEEPCPGKCKCIYDETEDLNKCPSADFQKCQQDPEAIWQWNGLKYACVCKNDKYCNKKGVIGNCPTETEAKCLSDELADWDGVNCTCKYDPNVDPTATGQVCPTKQYVCEQDCNATWDASCAKECYCTHDKNGDVFGAKPGSCPTAEEVCNKVTFASLDSDGMCKCTDDTENTPGNCRSLEVICTSDPEAVWDAAALKCNCTYWDFDAKGIGKNVDDDLEDFKIGDCPTEDYVCAIDPFASWKTDAAGNSSCQCDHDPNNKPGACRCLQEVCEEDGNADYNKVANTCTCKYDFGGKPGSCMTREEFMCSKNGQGTIDPATGQCVCKVGVWNSDDGLCILKCRDATTDAEAAKATDCHADEMCGEFSAGAGYQCASLRCEEAKNQDQADHAHNCGSNQVCTFDTTTQVAKCV